LGRGAWWDCAWGQCVAGVDDGIRIGLEVVLAVLYTRAVKMRLLRWFGEEGRDGDPAALASTHLHKRSGPSCTGPEDCVFPCGEELLTGWQPGF
jgi:hypothetical protein